MTKVKITENSWLAKVTAYKLSSDSVAIVIGKTIYLHNSSRSDFLSNPRWVSHEIAHVKQYLKLGIIRFLVLYLIETFMKGYQNNRFEVDAREKEKDLSALSDVYFS